MAHHGAERVGHFENRAFTKEEHHNWALKLWERMDRDHSGEITKEEMNCDEFQDVLRSIVAPENTGDGARATYGRAEMHIQQALDFLLRKADVNNDGTLSFKEFKSFLRILRNQGDAKNRVHLIFALFDLDGTNTIDREEFVGIWKFFVGHSPTFVELTTHFGKLDRLDKGEVTRDHFARWLKYDAPPEFKQHAAAVEEEAPSEKSSTKSVSRRVRKIHRPAPGMMFPRSEKAEAQTWTNSWHTVWNDRFRGRDDALMNPTCPKLLKHYFSAPQTLPELDRFYSTYRGFEKHKMVLTAPAPPTKRPVLSTQSSMPEVNPERALPGGWSRNKKGHRVLWDNEWPEKASDPKRRIGPGTLLLRCPGKPPPCLYLGRDAPA